ncbi:SdpI family protein [Nakamurella endophytica]|uniref:SdpI family protein n=1 Tax=Nakamurella endophytica TaxID=1748367 RepID=A0A917WEZ6_9ACTN|nr:SdpI family protein [Nakamurella endophytica]GGL96820.1 hypothetical protein GCM10011594_15710 [Nakamurella endophytica]
MPGTPLALSLPLGLLLVLLAGGAAVQAWAGWTGRLRRTGRWGVRTPAASDNDTAFATANRVAAPVLAGAAVAGLVAAAVVLLASLPVAATVVVAVIGLVAVVALAVAGTALGERAARTLPVPARRPVGGGACGGCGCGDGGCAALTRRSTLPAQG